MEGRKNLYANVARGIISLLRGCATAAVLTGSRFITLLGRTGASDSGVTRIVKMSRTRLQFMAGASSKVKLVGYNSIIVPFSGRVDGSASLCELCGAGVRRGVTRRGGHRVRGGIRWD